MSKNTIILVLLIFNSFFSTAQTSPWQSTSFPSGYVSSLAAIGNTIFAAAGNGVYSSSDFGLTWSYLLNSGYTTVVYTKGTNLYAGNGNGLIWYSTNLGSTWTNITNSPLFAGGNITSILENGAYLYIINANIGQCWRILLSFLNPYGGGWAQSNAGWGAPWVKALAFDGNYLMGGTYGNGFYKSTPGVPSWTVSNTGIGNLNIRAMAANNSTVYVGTDGAQQIYKSVNGGNSWLPSGGTAFSTNSNVYTIITNSNDIYVGTDLDGVIYSNDGGISWTSFNAGFKNSAGNWYCINGQVGALLMLGNTLFAGTSCGVWKASGCSYPTNITPQTSLNICQNSSIQLGVTGLGLINWYSNLTSTLSITTGTGYSTPTLTSNTTYYVGNDICPQREAITVTVMPLPTITVNSGTICPGQNFVMIPQGANTYTFSTGSQTVNPTSTVSYSVMGTDTNGCVSATPAICSVNVSPPESVPTISSDSLICVGETSTLTVPGVNSFTWNSGQNALSLLVSPVATTTYSGTGTDYFGCTITSSITQQVSLCTDIYENTFLMETRIDIYPNPSSGSFIISTKDYSRELSVIILNELGIEVANQNLLPGENIFTSKLTNGFYYCEFKHNGITIACNKIIIN